ncbi:hypothetical protein TBLA_0C05190 [Henningerozyma blattae CBS 6284]|uniref:HCP-like protein n=1 Tax=Henningerozyma blattae (strain ATCC 34711 / CBS 6284 / DSM 70876 / NBRC 10599 / NRRL Y-10934 / UCD 77-7) TaxID=1071380 RepID=I2H1R3_HENB6|nr:hypothetical protein TBLA_0C05190 [Tetrapisispora blattae CBS 6284]CCH60315.1 hypothetical protein TBLA_0C05190 [Tetrapisispora blattae CBS 6284]
MSITKSNIQYPLCKKECSETIATSTLPEIYNEDGYNINSAITIAPFNDNHKKFYLHSATTMTSSCNNTTDRAVTANEEEQICLPNIEDEITTIGVNTLDESVNSFVKSETSTFSPGNSYLCFNFTSKFPNHVSNGTGLSHVYSVNGRHDVQQDNRSVVDLSYQLISQYLGEAKETSLVPRLTTIEMYRENVKKSKDIRVLFGFAQYILQMALTIENSSSIIDPNNQKSREELKEQFLKEAKNYLKKLSVKGYVDAQYLLGDAYASGAINNGKVNNKESFQLFQSAAKHGHIESAYRTAYCYENGLGTTKDSRKSLDFLKFAASRNHPSAMYKLGLYMFYGRMGFDPADINSKLNGIKWLSRASARANELTCAAPYELAKIYQRGFIDVVLPDEKYATELYIQSATLGHVKSCTVLGEIYETGNVAVKRDSNLSIHYYTQGALQGDPKAMLGLCAWYLVGAGDNFEKDENEAFEWALKAANCGYAKAQYTAGYFYEKGKGCDRDEVMARKWYERAAKNKDERAMEKLKSSC